MENPIETSEDRQRRTAGSYGILAATLAIASLGTAHSMAKSSEQEAVCTMLADAAPTYLRDRSVVGKTQEEIIRQCKKTYGIVITEESYKQSALDK